jgi:hypothetical protein
MMIETVDATQSLALPQTSLDDQKMHAESAAIALEALVARLSKGDGFAEEFAAHPKSALGGAGIVLQKEGIEFLMSQDPERFDRITDVLFDMLDPDVLNNLVGPSCDGANAQ